VDMARSLAKVEDDALQLSEEERARLAARLLASLEEEAESPEELEKLWLAEAEQRFRELQTGVVRGVPARDVFAQLRAKLLP
jgi:putative addiction module component (TIGR02574 family)